MHSESFYLPLLYADHHVTEVRRILLEIPGVVDVYASSCFHEVEVQYDPAQTDISAIQAALEQTGYTQEPAFITESGTVKSVSRDDVFFRHTAAYQQLGKSISFAQDIQSQQRPLWPCPGFGTVSTQTREED